MRFNTGTENGGIEIAKQMSVDLKVRYAHPVHTSARSSQVLRKAKTKAAAIISIDKQFRSVCTRAMNSEHNRF